MADGRPAFLVDPSALHRLTYPAVEERLRPLMEQGLVATCAIIDLEMLYSSRNRSDYEANLLERRSFPDVPITPEITTRAIAVQRALASIGHHRVAVGDLVIAAAGELADLTVLHYDADYETIATVTEQPHEWVVGRGTI